MKKNILLIYMFGVFSLTSLSSCIEDKFHNAIDSTDSNNNGEITAKGLTYAEQFNGRTDTEIDITSDIDHMFVNVYAENPYDEESGEITVEPILQGYTPLKETIKLANHVKTLYVQTPFDVIKSTSPRIVLNYKTRSSALQSRAGATVKEVNAAKSIVSYSKEDINKIASLIPEQSHNFTFEDISKCTDIEITNDDTNIWMTFINDGNGNYSKKGLVWFYTYDASLTKPTIPDCTFYYYDSTEAAIKPFESNASPYSNGDKKYNDIKDKYLFYNLDEKDGNTQRDEFSRLYLGSFNKGVKIGFAGIFYNDDNTIDRITRMSTPCLTAVDQYMGKICTLGPVISKPMSNMIVFCADDYNIPNSGVGVSKYVVGMENRMPVEAFYEPDFNDMVMLIETSKPVKSVEEVKPQEQGTNVFLNGYYLFEDNYPNAGDFDYNDVVISYHIESNKNKKNDDPTRNKVIVRLMANGCNFTNEFGFRVGDKYYPLIKDIKGYMNVDQNNTGILTDESDLKIYSTTIPGSISQTQTEWFIRPYLYNGKGYVYNTTILNVENPYVLDVPSFCNAKNNLLNIEYRLDESTAKKSFELRWMREGNNILKGYKSIKTKDWYLNSNITDHSKVIRRIESDPLK